LSIEVHFFASLADRAGRRSTRVELPAGATVEVLWVRLIADFPGLQGAGQRPMVACDLEYASWDRRLDDVREVAFLPPVSGG
jgi:molybdopterin converting factor subunit 1